jgi:hypothetical protein
MTEIKKTKIHLVFIGGFIFACFCLAQSTLAANVQFTNNSVIDLSGLSTTLYALSGSECDSLTVNGSTLTVDVPSGSTFTLGTVSNNILRLAPSGSNAVLTLDSSNMSSGYVSQWIVNSSSSPTVSFLVGSLTPNVSYLAKADNIAIDYYSSNASSEISFNSSVGSVSKTFTIEKQDRPSSPSGGAVILLPQINQTTTTNQKSEQSVKNQQTNQLSSSSVPFQTTTISGCQKFKTNLSYGSRGSQVECLQKLLKAQGKAIYPEGTVSGWFGPVTKRAVIRFQEKYAKEILKPSGLKKGTGLVGTSTRTKLNQMLGK